MPDNVFVLRPLLDGRFEVWVCRNGMTAGIFPTSAKALAWIARNGREATEAELRE
jgi:hypothetical protein